MAAARRAVPAVRRAVRRAADLQAGARRRDHAGDGAAYHGRQPRTDRARLPAADPGTGQLHGQRLAAVVLPRDTSRAVADPGAGEGGRRRDRHPVLQPAERKHSPGERRVMGGAVSGLVLRGERLCGWLPAAAEHELVQDFHGAESVLAGGVDVAADVEAVLGDVVAGEAAGDLLLGFQGPDSALADIVRGPDSGV